MRCSCMQLNKKAGLKSSAFYIYSTSAIYRKDCLQSKTVDFSRVVMYYTRV